jgi:hypothetical protein
MIGEWRGRQAEEIEATKVNEALVDALHTMYERDIELNPTNKNRYVNLFDPKGLDPVLKDAAALFPNHLRTYAVSKFGSGQFYVRRNMLDLTVGYRNASVGDFWTGNTRHSKKTQELLKNSFISILGIDAYRKLVWGERNWQAAMATVRTNIVIRSLVVPAANFVSGIYQLRTRGVPLHVVLKAIPGKVTELEYYTKTWNEKIKLEAERLAVENNVVMTNKIDARLKTIDDSLKRLSIWPLIEAGEFSTISEVGQTADDLGVGPDTLVASLEAAVAKLPPGLRDLARQGYFAKDTTIFRTLQKSVQYSDFVMKAVYFDHMMKIEKTTVAQAKSRVTEEFNNYDIPPGRTRGYVESIGMAWFLNFKIRSVKIALSTIRNNPLDLLIYSIIPHPFASGIPVTDNFFATLFDGTLPFSVGPRMAVTPIALNPIYNLIGD